MAERVAIREYMEKAGASVEWDAATGTVVIDGQCRIVPDQIIDGKSYAPKAILDAALAHLGYAAPATAPSTALPPQEVRQEEQAREREMNLASRSLPSLSGWLEIVKQRLVDPVWNWIKNHIWNPLLNWSRRLVASFRDLMVTVSRFPAVVWEWGQKIRHQITVSARFVQQEIIEWYGAVVDFLKKNWGRLEWLISGLGFTVVGFLGLRFDALRYWLDYGLDRLVGLVEAPLHTVADWVVSSFEYWSEKVFDLIEDYIVAHWEGD